MASFLFLCTFVHEI